MPLKDYPRAKRFLDEIGEEEDDLDSVLREVKLNRISKDLDELQLYAEKNESENFYNELDQILRLSDDGVSTSVHVSAPEPVPQTFQNQSTISNTSPDSGIKITEARTTERVGTLFASPESQVRQSKNNFNEVVAVSYLTLALVIIWRLDLTGLDLFQSLTMGIGFAIIVPLFASEISTRDEEFEIWKLISTIAWLAVLLSGLIGVKFASSDSIIADVIFFEKNSEIFYIASIFIISTSIWLMPITNFEASKGLRNVSSSISATLFSILILFSLSNPREVFSIDSAIFISNIILMMSILWTITNLSFGKANIFVYGMVIVVILFNLINGDSTAIGNAIFPVAAWGLTVAAWDYDEEKIKPIILLPALFLHGLCGVLLIKGMVLTSTWLVLWLVFILFLEMTNRILSPNNHTVEQILPPQKMRGKILDLNKTIAIVGAKESGKSCYLGALWTSLNNNLVQELWYNSGERYLDGRDLPFPIENIKELMAQIPDELSSSLDDEKDILDSYLRHRSAKFSMANEIKSGAFPRSNNGFPFTLTALPDTRRFLDNYMNQLANNDLEKRKLLMATQGVDTNLQFSLEFVAKVIETKPVIFGLIQHSTSTKRKVRTTFRTMDLPGEDVTSTLDKISGKNFASKSVAELLHGVRSREQMFGAAVEYNLELLSVADNVLYIVDSDNFTNHGGSAQREVSSYLRLANNISKLEGSKLKHISLLLNKADLLLNRGDQKKRLMKEGGLSNWKSMLDRDHSMSTVEEVLGMGILQDLDVELDAYYSCTLGGLIENNKDDVVPTYPMVPVNVIEPLLRCLLPREDEIENTSSSIQDSSEDNLGDKEL